MAKLLIQAGANLNSKYSNFPALYAACDNVKLITNKHESKPKKSEMKNKHE